MRASAFLALLVTIAGTFAPAYAFHFVIYGDTRTNPATHQQVVSAYSAVNPELVIHTGDLYEGYTAAQFKTIITSRPNIAALLSSNLFLVARGNHETEAEVLAFSPPVVRNDSILYSFTDGNCFFVCVGYDPALNLAWTQARLESPAARTAAWRIVYSHVPVYSTGSGHGASGIPGFETLCDRFRVTMVFSGHDHIYERSKLIYGGAALNATRDFTADSGTVYVVAGGGGAPLYSAGSNWWTALSSSVNHWCDLTATDTQIKMVGRWINGAGFDSVTIHKPGTAIPAPGPKGVPGINRGKGKSLGEVQPNGRIITIETTLAGILTVYDPHGNLCHYVGVTTADRVVHAFQAEKPGTYLIQMRSDLGNETRKVAIR
jgi:acid phosphatase type 7